MFLDLYVLLILANLCILPVDDLKTLLSVNFNKIFFTVNSYKPGCPVNSSKFARGPVDVRTVNSNKPLCPVNSSKPVFLVDVRKGIRPVHSNKVVHTVNSNKPVNSRTVHPFNSGKPVCPGNSSKPVRLIDAHKSVRPMNF